MPQEVNELLKQFDEQSHPKPEDVQVNLSKKTQDLARELIEKIQLQRKMMTELAEVNKRINSLAYRELPDLFNEQGLTMIGTDTGARLEMKPFYKANISSEWSDEKREDAFDYLAGIAPDLIKTEVVVSFNADDFENARLLQGLIKDMGFEPDLRKAVHHMTLTAFVKHRFLAGEEIDMEKLGATIGSKVSVYVLMDDKYEALDRLKKLKSSQGAQKNDAPFPDDEVPF